MHWDPRHPRLRPTGLKSYRLDPYRTQELERRKHEAEDDEPIHRGGEHMAESCGLCQKLRRMHNNPFIRCDDGRRRGDRDYW